MNDMATNNRKAKMLISRVYRLCYPSQWLRVSNRRVVLFSFSGIAREGVKDKRRMGDWRFFISEPGIISVEDLPPGWGLLHVVNGRVRKVHGWPKGNCCWGNPDDKPFTGNKQVECDYMLSALRRMELRGHLNEIYDGVIVNKKEGNAA